MANINIIIDNNIFNECSLKFIPFNFALTTENNHENEMIEFYKQLISDYPIISIEDAVAEEDWDAWKKLTETIGDKCQLVGDDLFVTNPIRLERGINNGVANK